MYMSEKLVDLIGLILIFSGQYLFYKTMLWDRKSSGMDLIFILLTFVFSALLIIFGILTIFMGK